MFDNQAGLWIALWLAGAGVSIGLYFWSRRHTQVGPRLAQLRLLMLAGILPCGGFNIVFSLIFFVVFMIGSHRSRNIPIDHSPAPTDHMPHALPGRPRLPMTSYGYQPPAEATAHGWCCPNPDCGVSEHEVVHRWPKPCPECGTNTDPLFDPPWDHDAEPLKLAWQRDRATGSTKDFWQALLIAWHYKDALLHGRPAVAEDVRRLATEFLDSREKPDYMTRADLHARIIWAALEYDHLDAAANQLALWMRRSVFDRVDDDANQRAEVRMLLDAQLRYLRHPGSQWHAGHEFIKVQAREVASVGRNVLTGDHLNYMYLLNY